MILAEFILRTRIPTTWLLPVLGSVAPLQEQLPVVLAAGEGVARVLRPLPRDALPLHGLVHHARVEVVAGLKAGDQIFTEKPVDFTPLPKGPASPPPAAQAAR